MPAGTKPVTRKQFKLGEDNVNVVESERIGSQTPTNCWVPDYDRTVGDRCMEFLDAVGVNLDPWQRFCLVESLGLTPSGPGGREKWSAKEVALLVPRQQGKLRP